MKEKKARVEDALHATRAAVEEGIVPGGGVALIRALLVARRASSSTTTSSSASTSSAAPSRSRCARSPRTRGVDGSIVVDKVKNGKGAFGYNAATDEYEDLVEAGVIDPTKVVRAALQNAASVASLMLTTEALIAERPEEEGGRRRRWPRRWRRRDGRHGRHGRRDDDF